MRRILPIAAVVAASVLTGLPANAATATPLFVAYPAANGYGQELDRVTLDLHGKTVTKSPVVRGTPGVLDWIPSDTHAGYVTGIRESRVGGDVFVVSRTGTHLRTLTGTHDVGDAVFTRDGHSVLFIRTSGSGAGSSLWTVPATGGTSRMLGDFGTLAYGLALDPRKTVVYTCIYNSSASSCRVNSYDYSSNTVTDLLDDPVIGTVSNISVAPNGLDMAVAVSPAVDGTKDYLLFAGTAGSRWTKFVASMGVGRGTWPAYGTSQYDVIAERGSGYGLLGVTFTPHKVTVIPGTIYTRPRADR